MAASSDSRKAFDLQVEVDNVIRMVTVDQPLLDRINNNDPLVRESAYADLHRLLQSEKVIDSEVTENLPEASENPEIPSFSTSRVVPVPASFTKEQTRCLICLYKERIDKFESSCQKKKTLWYDITNDLNLQCASSYTQKQVEGRWKTIVAVYRKHKDERNRSGNGAKSYEFEKELDEILVRSHDTVPVLTVSSIESKESKQQEGSSLSNSSSPEGEPLIKKRKARVSTSAKVIDYMKSLAEEEKKREQDRMERMEKMHQDKMTLFKEFINIIKKDKSD